MKGIGKLGANLLKSIQIIFVVAAIVLVFTTQESFAQPVKYDGTKGYVTISLEHEFTSHLPAIKNMTVFHFTGEIPVVVHKVGKPGYMAWTQI